MGQHHGVDTQLLEVVLDAIDEGVVVLDRDELVRVCSDRARHLLGLDDVRIVGRPWGAVLDALRVHGDPVADGELDAYGPSIGEVTLHDGRVVAWKRHPLTDGGALQVLQDISELRVLESDLLRASNIDALTGAMNRRRFYEAAEHEIVRSRRYGRAMTVIVLNVDRFKPVNDEHGYRAGDQVLSAVAQGCHGVLRTSDAFGRLSGGEFGVLLTETSPEEAMIAAERLRQWVSSVRVLLDTGVVLHVTASLGVTSLREDDDVDSVLHRAERAMRQAKEDGRDRVALAAD